MAEYKKVKIERGKGGWGGPLEVKPTDEKKYIVCITGGGIHPVAQKIADMTGAEPFDGFKSSPEGGFEAMACAVIDCGGTARIGVYPMKGVPTIDIHDTSPAGPLAQFIREENFVSGVSEEQITEI